MKGTQLDFRTTKPQSYYCEWEGREVPVRFAGRCVVCGRTTYQTQEENGHWKDPDPRGVLGVHTSAVLDPHDYGMGGIDIPACYPCRDSQPSYLKALEIAKTKWSKINE